MNIAIDAMGGNYAPKEIVKGAVEAAKELNINIILVGNKKGILELIGEEVISNINICHCSEVINMDEIPIKAIRKKKTSSMGIAFDLVKHGLADGVISAGNSGAFIASAVCNIGLLRHIDKPAVASILPGRKGSVILIDSGANVDCKISHIFQFALLGHCFATAYLGIKYPKIGLLSIGEENSKGNKLVKRAYKLLRNSPLNSIGNIEGTDIFNGDIDVAVCDGFVGNIALKICEGLAQFVSDWIVHEIKDLLSVEKIIKRLDYEEYGGGVVVGINGLGILCHGRSSSKAIKKAIFMAVDIIKKRVLEGISKEFESILINHKGENYAGI